MRKFGDSFLPLSNCDALRLSQLLFIQLRHFQLPKILFFSKTKKKNFEHTRVHKIFETNLRNEVN